MRVPSGPSPYGSTAEPEDGSFVERIRPYTDKIEDLLDTYSDPVKPCVFRPPRSWQSLAD